MSRCTATNANGSPCRAWAVKQTQPPRCAAHGGTTNTNGAPAGNQNATTHGAYTSNSPPQGPDKPADFDARIADLDRRIMHLSAYIDAHLVDLQTEHYIKLLNLLGLLTSRLGRLLRDRAVVAPEDRDELQTAINGALDDLAAQWGADL